MPHERRRPLGRPPIRPGDPSTGLGVKLPGSEFDALCKAARAQRVGVADLARRFILQKLHDVDRDK